LHLAGTGQHLLHRCDRRKRERWPDAPLQLLNLDNLPLLARVRQSRLPGRSTASCRVGLPSLRALCLGLGADRWACLVNHGQRHRDRLPKGAGLVGVGEIAPHGEMPVFGLGPAPIEFELVDAAFPGHDET
jgi:hypothetical protein